MDDMKNGTDYLVLIAAAAVEVAILGDEPVEQFEGLVRLVATEVPVIADNLGAA